VIRLRAGQPGFDSRQGQRVFLCHRVQIGSGTHSPSYPIGAGDSFPGVRTAEE